MSRLNSFDEKINEQKNNNQKLDAGPGDEALRKAIFYAKSIYQPKNNQYFVNNAEIEFVAELCLKKFGFEAIESLYNSFKDQKLLGLIKRKWTVNSMEDDIQKITGVFEEKGTLKVGMPEKERFNWYINLVYADNIPGVMVLESPPDEYLTKIAAEAYLKLKIEDLEALMDYQLLNEDFRFSRYGKKITFEDLQKDVNEAVNFKLK